MQTLIHKPTLAILMAVIGFGVFSFSDAISRYLVHTQGYSVFFLVGLFQALGLMVLLTFHEKLGGLKATLASRNKKWHVARALMLSISVPANMYAFSVLPFALTYTLLFTGAFFLLLLSAVITKETIPPRKALAIILGMAGAVIVLRPWADGFDWRMLIPIVSAVMYACQSLLARRMGAQETTLSLAFYSLIICGSIMWMIAFTKGVIHMPSSQDWPFILAAGLCVGIGTLCVPLAFRYANASVVGPFHYTQLIWAAVIGAVFFNELPDIYTIIGGMLIVSGGIMALLAARRESP